MWLSPLDRAHTVTEEYLGGAGTAGGGRTCRVRRREEPGDRAGAHLGGAEGGLRAGVGEVGRRRRDRRKRSAKNGENSDAREQKTRNYFDLRNCF